MSNEEYANLIDFLSRKFARIDARFEQIDARFEQVDARFDQVDARFAQVDQRLTRLEVAFEEFRHDVKAIADVGQQNARRLDRIERKIA